MEVVNKMTTKDSITEANFVCEECGAEVDYNKIGAHMRAHEAEDVFKE